MPSRARSATSSGGPAARVRFTGSASPARLGERALLLARVQVEPRDLLGGARLRRPPAAAAA